MFDGFKYQGRLLEALRRETDSLPTRPCVGVVRVGESVASTRFIQRKREAVHKAGMHLVEFPLRTDNP